MNNWIKYIFLAYLLFGTILVGDYGLSMDEPVQRKHGIVAFEYVNELIGFYPDLPNLTVEHRPNHDHRDYGMLFQMVAYGLELALGIDNTRDIFRLRHLMVFVLFWAAAWVFYGILYRRFKSVPPGFYLYPLAGFMGRTDRRLYTFFQQHETVPLVR